MVVDPMGQIIAQSPVSEPHLLVTDIDLDLIATARAQSPLLSDLSSAWADIRRLTQQVDI
jgi:predicted amidohydrolase